MVRFEINELKNAFMNTNSKKGFVKTGQGLITDHMSGINFKKKKRSEHE